MGIKRDTSGLIDLQVQMLEQVAESKELDINQRMRHVNRLIDGIASVAGLDLAYKKFIAKAPRVAKEAAPLQLVQQDKED